MNDIFEKIQAEFDAFMKQAKELVEKERVADARKTKRWKPKEDDIFYYVADNGCVMSLKTDDYISDYVENLYDFYNIFKTEEEAQKELDRRIAEQELLDLVDLDNETDLMWSIVYSIDNGAFDVVYHHHSPYRFASKEEAQKAIDTLGTDKLKLIFRIED